MWVVVPLVVLVVYHVVTSEEMLGTVRSRVALVTVLMIEVVLTFALHPRLGSDPIPFVLGFLGLLSDTCLQTPRWPHVGEFSV